MQEKHTPALVPPTTQGNLSDLPRRNARRDPQHPALARRRDDGWDEVTAEQFEAEVTSLAKGLLASGIAAGDRIAVMSRTRYEWTLIDFAIWTAGAVCVPIYETSSAEQVQWILGDSGAVAVFVETDRHASTVEEIRPQVPALREVWQIDAGAVADLVAAGEPVPEADLDARRQIADRTSIATIIYTSGTTGRPKGCQLTHGNFMDLSENIEQRFGPVFAAQPSTLLFLPLAHVFARLIQVLCLQVGATIAHSHDISALLDDFATFRPTFILAVPRVFEKIYNTSEQRATADGKGRIFRMAAATAVEYSRAQDSGGAGPLLRLKHLVFDRLVYGKLRAAMGGRVTYVVSGGAPLGERLGHFYRGIGVIILEGYGLTETTAPAAVNTIEHSKIGTVGPPLPGVSMRIAADGEVQIRGNNVFAGYHGNAAATAEALQDGWFNTGDVGTLDEDGYLRITGRKKEILVTAGGKNVAPAVLEDRLRDHPLVSQCIVVGDQRPFIAALLTLDADMYPAWAANNGLSDVSLDEARTHPTVRAELDGAVADANKAVSKAESIRVYDVLETDFTEENGYLTPSMKLRRNVVMKNFADRVEALYAKPKP